MLFRSDHETSGGLACSNTFVLHGLMGHALKGAAIVLARHEGWWIEDSGDLCPDHAWETVDHAEYCPICIHAACQVQEKA